MRRTIVRGLLTAAAVALALPATASAALQETPCGTGAFLCSHVTVPLDRTGAVPGTVALDVHRLPAGAAPTRTAIVTLLGGPGQPAIPAAGELAALLGPVRGDRDLLVFDERGVGGSGALRCNALRSSRGSESEKAARCAAELGPARGLYTTPASVEDLDAIRQAGGYDQLVLFGVSYGTKLALDYAAAHPDRVERVVLDSVVTPEGPDPLQLESFAAMPRVLGELCARGACRGITSKPSADVAALVRRLARRPLRGRLVTGTGRAVGVRLTPVSVLNVLLGGDLNPVLRAETPAAIRAALRGDGAPLARLRVRAAGIGAVARTAAATRGASDQVAQQDVNRARYTATVCEEVAFPWDRGAPPNLRAGEAEGRVRALGPARVAPFDRETALAGGLLPLCVRWPVASAAPAPVTLPSGIPALLLAGEQDLRTPLEDARQVAERLGGGAQLVAVPDVGHSVLGGDPSGCALAALAGFMGGGQAAPCPASRPLVVPTPVPPRRVASLRPYRGVAGLAGRTLTAASRTVADALRSVAANDLAGQLPGRLGGLRGGTATLVAGDLLLRRYSFVPGVALDGLVPADDGAALRLRVTGRSAARGTFTVNRGRIIGRLGGKAFNVKAAPTATAARAAHRGAAAPFPRLARMR